MKKKIFIITISLILLGLLILIYFQRRNFLEEFQNKQTINLKDEILSTQKEINKKLDQIKNNETYTFDNPYVEQNPYQISPLSAIIIFHTEKECEINIYLNEKHIMTTKKEKQHAIPIYGLYENQENKVKLIKDQEEKIITLKTEKSNLEPLTILENHLEEESFYFMTASYKSGLSAYDNSGNLRFYLKGMYRMDVEWLENGHFLIGIPNGQFAENFYGMVEMDYLGKIYNYYTLEHGVSFEIEVLKNGNYLIAGGFTPVYIKEQTISEIDPLTGNTLDTINIAEIIKEIDPNFNSDYLGQKAIRNGFAYNEETKDLIISFRGINTLLSINKDTKKLNWIFTNQENEVFQAEVWKNYFVTSEDNNYPWGQHAPILTKEGYIAFFNNGYDRYHGFEVGGLDFTKDYKDNYSRAEIYKIENKIATPIWTYDENKTLFSHQYGSIKITENNSKLINFGWTLKNEYRNNLDATLSNSEKNIDNTYAAIIEIDEKENIIWKANCEEGKYRVMKHNLYDNPKEIDFKILNIKNSIPSEKLETTTIKQQDIENTQNWIYNVTLTNHYFETNYPIQQQDQIEFYFIDKYQKVHKMIYKEKSIPEPNRIFHLELPKGEYLFYIKINNVIWNTFTKIKN